MENNCSLLRRRTYMQGRGAGGRERETEREFEKGSFHGVGERKKKLSRPWPETRKQ